VPSWGLVQAMEVFRKATVNHRVAGSSDTTRENSAKTRTVRQLSRTRGDRVARLSNSFQFLEAGRIEGRLVRR